MFSAFIKSLARIIHQAKGAAAALITPTVSIEVQQYVLRFEAETTSLFFSFFFFFFQRSRF